MSDDGASAKTRPPRAGRSAEGNTGQAVMVGLLLLAVVATVVMILTDSAMWMRLATLAALWAALLGVFLVGRYKRQAATEATRARDLHTVYELQLEREISARREHELIVEKQLREQVRQETSSSVVALRHEIAALREQLSQLTGVTLAADQPSVGSTTTQPAITANLGSPTAVPSERVVPPLSGVDPEATPSTERTERLSPVHGIRRSTAVAPSVPVADDPADLAATDATGSDHYRSRSSATPFDTPQSTDWDYRGTRTPVNTGPDSSTHTPAEAIDDQTSIWDSYASGEGSNVVRAGSRARSTRARDPEPAPSSAWTVDHIEASSAPSIGDDHVVHEEQQWPWTVESSTDSGSTGVDSMAAAARDNSSGSASGLGTTSGFATNRPQPYDPSALSRGRHETPSHIPPEPAEVDYHDARHSEGSTVSELMARLNSESGRHSSGGRRRRAED